MFEFTSNSSSPVRLQGISLPLEGSVVVVFLATLTYLVILFCNLVLMVTIALSKSLHQPMYFLLFNLPINDLIGSSATLPHIINEILRDSRYIEVSSCIFQAFCVHIYATGSILILSVMSYDRYVAICSPLLYSTIMTNTQVMKMIATVWVVNIVMIVGLFSLLLRLPRCRSLKSQPYCDNPSLLTLVCADTAINNIYGLIITAIVQIAAVGMIIYTYLHILVACFKNKRSDTKSKALQTCATHLTVFLILEFSGLFTITSYRFKQLSPHFRRMIGATGIVFSPTVNPLIYGLKTKAIRQRIVSVLRQRMLTSSARK